MISNFPKNIWNATVGSSVKNTYCSCRGPHWSSVPRSGSSQAPVTRAPGDLGPSLASVLLVAIIPLCTSRRPTLQFHLCEMVWCLSVCDWFISVTIMASRFIRVVYKWRDVIFYLLDIILLYSCTTFSLSNPL